MSQENQEQNQPHISVISQYIKDLSFENPAAPESLQKSEEAPKIDLALDLKVNKLSEENIYEVEMIIEASATIKDKNLFIIDLKYAGIFELINFDDNQKDIILAVHCPTTLFPFARKIISDTTQSGGYQPLMIDPIDFGMLYNKKLMENENDKN